MSFFNKLKPSAAAANASNNLNPNKKKDDAAQEQTPLEKMLVNAGPVRDDGLDKFFGLENFGNTCYCNSILQVLYHSEPFRKNVVQFPPYSPADTPNGKPRRVNVQIRKHSEMTTTPTPGTAAAAALNALRNPPAANHQNKNRQPLPGQLPNGPATVRPEDKPDTPEYKKKHAMIKGPVLELTDNASAYGMEESTFTSVKDIFTAFIESSSRTGVLSPHRLLEIFRKENELFRTAMHQDAHEFYGLVLNDIIKTVEETATKQRQEQADDKDGLKDSVQSALDDGRYATAASDGTSSPGSGWVHDIFEGVLTSETRCLTCEAASQRDETFLDLSIDLEEHSSVTSCLRKFSAEEMLCERNKFHCDHCGGLQEAEKRMKIKRLPKILALHLKRFKYSEDYTKLEKLFHRVVYPYQLRMFNTTDDAQDPDRLYELYAVVVHIGGHAYHGHYVSVIKTKERGWLLFDDEMVEPVDKHYVRNFFGEKPGTACAYVLFYQETTFEKVQAEQELEGLEEIRLASQSAGLYLSPEELQQRNAANGAGLTRQITQPVGLSPVDTSDDLAGLEHARTAPGPTLSPITSAPDVPSVPTIPAHATNGKAEAARLKEDREREKKEAKAAEKARKAQEKENAKGVERQRKERDAQRRSEADELRRVIAVSKQTAAEERETRKSSMDLGSKTSGFLGRGGSRGSKSMSRKSFGFLAKDKDKDGKAAVPESPFIAEEPAGTASSNGGAPSSSSTNGPSANGSSSGAPLTQQSTQVSGAAASPLSAVLTHTQSRKERFSFGLGKKKSNSFLP